MKSHFLRTVVVPAGLMAVTFLAACGSPSTGSSKLGFDPSKPAPACPTLPGVSNVRISGQPGPDFWTCSAIHTPSGKQLFHVYVGNHPNPPKPGFRYGATTGTGDKTLVWFVTPTGGWDKPRFWQTFIPTGDDRLSIMVVTFGTTGLITPDKISPLIAHLRVGH